MSSVGGGTFGVVGGGVFGVVADGGGGGSYADVVLADSPVGYWPLAESSGTTASDLSGNGIDGAYVGSPTLGVVGPDGGNAILTSWDSYVEIPNSTEWNFGPALSLEAWVKRSALGQSIGIVVLGSNNAGFYFNTNDGLRYLRTQFEDIYSPATPTVSDSAWHHLVVTSDGINRLRFYIDGVVAASPGPLPAIAVVNNGTGLPKTIGGAYQATLAALAPTYFAHAAVYDYELLAVQVTAHYSAMFA